MPRSYAIGEFAEELGVHPETIKRWCRSDDLDYTRTPGGDRRIPHRELLRLAGDDRLRDQVALYVRVSSHGQKENGDLERLLNHHGVTITVLEEETDKTAQEELVDDLIKLVASFSGKLYGMRSGEKQRVVNAVETEVNTDD